MADKTFVQHFTECMGDLGLPAPGSLFTSATTVTAMVAAIEKAVATYGTEVTIGELVGAGLLSDALLVVGALSASYYAGASLGCLGTAGVDWIDDLTGGPIDFDKNLEQAREILDPQAATLDIPTEAEETSMDVTGTAHEEMPPES
jgi:hypothetical protein